MALVVVLSRPEAQGVVSLTLPMVLARVVAFVLVYQYGITLKEVC